MILTLTALSSPVRAPAENFAVGQELDMINNRKSRAKRRSLQAQWSADGGEAGVGPIAPPQYRARVYAPENSLNFI